MSSSSNEGGPSPEIRNQCDGCARGLELDRYGLHSERSDTGEGVRILGTTFVCTRHMYVERWEDLAARLTAHLS